MNVIIIGAGGHARVVFDIIRQDHNINVSSFIDNTPRGSEETIMGVPVVGPHDSVPDLIDKRDISGYIVAVGDNQIRRDHFRKFRNMGLEPVTAIHPNAHISETVSIGAGSVVASGVNISTNAEVGENSIVNTGSIIDHETTLGSDTHVGPGTTIAGRVSIGAGTFVGMGCSVKEFIDIGSNVVVGAGSVVLEDIEPSVMVAGTPAEVKNPRES